MGNTIGRLACNMLMIVYVMLFHWSTEAYSTFRASMKGPAEWLESNLDLWPLVLPEAETRMLMEASSDSSWLQLSDEIQKVVDSGPLGTRLFGFAYKLILGELVEEAICKHVRAMLKKTPIKEEAFVESMKQAKLAVADISGVEALPERRQIEVRYRGWPISLKIQCLADEVSFRHAAALRELAVESGDLLPLACEEILFILVVPVVSSLNLECMCVKLHVLITCHVNALITSNVKDQLLGMGGMKEKNQVALKLLSKASQAREWANSLLDGNDFDPEIAKATTE